MPRASGLDGLALVGREVGQTCRLPVELGAHHVVAARADRADQRREVVGAAAHHVPMDLLGDELVGPHDVARGSRVVRGEPLAERDDVDHPHVVHRRTRSRARRRGAPRGPAGRGAGRRDRRSHRPRRSPVHHDARGAGRAHDEVGLPRSRRASASRSPCSAFVRSASARACSRERFRMRTGPTPRWRRCFTASAAICPAPTTTTSRPPSPPRRLVGEVGAQRHERVGRGAERRLLADTPAGARRRVEEPGERGTGGALALGPPQRLAHLCVDLRLARGPSSRARSRRRTDGRRRPAPSGSTAGSESSSARDAPRLGEQALQRQEARVVARRRSP